MKLHLDALAEQRAGECSLIGTFSLSKTVQVYLLAAMLLAAFAKGVPGVAILIFVVGVVC